MRPEQAGRDTDLGVFLCLIAGLAGCAAPKAAPSSDAGVMEDGPQVRFQLAGEGVPFGDVPFPDDLYRDADGGVRVATSPALGPTTALVDEMLSDLARVQGFSPTAPVFLRVDGEVDPNTLPSDAAASMRQDATVFLLDIDPSSPNAFSRVPIECRWSSDRGLLTARPARGEPLSGGRKYALVVTRRVLSPEGEPLGPSPEYRQVLDATAVPADARLSRVYRAHASAIAALGNVGLPKDDIAGLAVFSVQDVSAGLAAVFRSAEAFVASTPSVTHAVAGIDLDAQLGAPISGGLGLDAEGGVQHENVGWWIQGTVNVPNYLAGVAGELGRFDLGGDGLYTTRRVEVAPFTLSLPLVPNAVDTVELPLVIFLHGLGRDRADVLPLANQLNAAGYAVLAIDAPYHGLRRPNAADAVHRFSSAAGADGFADGESSESTGWFLGSDRAGDRASLHPAYVRDAVRQNVSDWLVVLRSIAKDPAWLASLPGLEAVSIATDRVGVIGVDVGGQVGAILSSHDARFGANILAFTGAGTAEWLMASPALRSIAEPLGMSLGVTTDDDPSKESPLHVPSVALWQTLADMGDALAFAPTLRRQPRDLLLISAPNDELLGVRATETFAGALRLPLVANTNAQYVTLSRGSAPLSHNATIASELTTQAFFAYESATRTLYAQQDDVLRFDATTTPPFAERNEPLSVSNPLDQALTQAVFFFESWRSGVATVIDPNAQLARSR